MGRFKKILHKLDRDLLTPILKDNELFILNLNRDQMYKDGVMDVNNPSSILTYAPSTIRQKKKKAKYKRTDHITLKWDGSFHGLMKCLFFKDKFVITSKDLKWPNYLEPNPRFQNALGLTEESKGKLRDLVKDEYIKYFRNAKSA